MVIMEPEEVWGVAAGMASGALAAESVNSFPAAFGSVPFHPAFPESCFEHLLPSGIVFPQLLAAK